MLINRFMKIVSYGLFVLQGKKDLSRTGTIRQRWNLTIPPSLCTLFALYIYAKTFLGFYHIDTDEFNLSISTVFSHSKVKVPYTVFLMDQDTIVCCQRFTLISSLLRYISTQMSIGLLCINLGMQIQLNLCSILKYIYNRQADPKLVTFKIKSIKNYKQLNIKETECQKTS